MSKFDNHKFIESEKDIMAATPTGKVSSVCEILWVGERYFCNAYLPDKTQAKANAKAIVHSLENYPLALEEIEHLQKEIVRVKKAASHFQSCYEYEKYEADRMRGYINNLLIEKE